TELATHIIEEIKLILTKKVQAVYYISISNEFFHFSHLSKSNLEVLEVVKTSVFLNKGSVFNINYCYLGIKRYLKDIYKKNIAENYYHPTLFNLISKDLSSKSELVKTLRVYLENDSKVGLTAEQLYIHPNTLNYRMKQMEEIGVL